MGRVCGGGEGRGGENVEGRESVEGVVLRVSGDKGCCEF